MSRFKKQETITFKVDHNLAEAMRSVPNRSEFIRTAIVSALKNQCPLCQGTGVMTDEQRQHWHTFIHTHSVEKCETCKATHIVCSENNECSAH